MNSIAARLEPRKQQFQETVMRIRRRLALPTPPKDDDEKFYPEISLVGLPNELLLDIVSRLEVSETACLSLCNRFLHCILNPQVSQALRITKTTNHYRSDFLIRLARDCPGLFYCYTCQKLQPTELLETPRSGIVLGGLDCTRDCDFSCRPCWSGSSYNFVYQHLELVLTRHRFGPGFGISIDELATTKLNTGDRTPFLRDNHIFNAEGRITDHDLSLRLQDIVIYTQDASRRYDWDLGIRICSHIDLPRYHSVHSALWCKTRRIMERVVDRCERCDVLLGCSKCNTEFEIEILAMGSGLMALILTRWINLGRGETPLDPRWRQHLPSKSYYDYRGLIVDVNERGSTRAAYERLDGLPVEMLTRDHLDLLRRRVVREIHPLRDTLMYAGPRTASNALIKRYGADHSLCAVGRGCEATCPNPKKRYWCKVNVAPACVVM